MKNYRIGIAGLLLLFSISLFAQEANKERLEEIVGVLASDDLKGRGFGTPDGKKAAEYIIQQFQESGVQPLREEGFLHTFYYRNGILNIVGNNVVGVVRGNDPELNNQYIVIGGHYDHLGWKLEDGDTVVYNGADDNASGVAGVIEIGRLLTENREWMGRSVILCAFDGEESGLIGSHAFVDELVNGPDAILEPESIVAMFSLDMIGMYADHNGIDLLGFELLKDHEQILADALDDAPVELVKVTGTIPNRTDTEPFGKIGIPAIHIFTGTESPYHKPEDDSDLLDYEGMADVTDFAAVMARELSTIPEIGKAKQLNNIAEKGGIKHFNPGITINTGASHFDYKNDFHQAKGVFAFDAGLFFQTRINQYLSIQPEVLYSWGGSQVDGTAPNEIGKLHTQALTVPVSLLLTSPDESGMGIRAYYQLGGYYSYIFGGSDQSGDLVFGPTAYNDTDYGMVFGFGFEIMHVRFGYVFQRSFVDFTNMSDNLDTRSKGSFVKLGWVF